MPLKTVETAAPKYSSELLTALESTLKAHNIRLKADQSLADVAEAFAANQVDLELTPQNYLAASMHGVPTHLHTVVESLAEKEPTRFYPRQMDNVESRDQLDHAGKMAFIRERGLSEWEKLSPTKVESRVVVLDPSRLSKKDWFSLSTKQRVDFIKVHGSGAVSAIMGRRA